MNNLELYKRFVHERHGVYLARQAGRPQPWTYDEVIASRKFTNVFRVLDPGSQFVFDLDTDDEETLIARLMLYRMTNLPSTWAAIRDGLGRYPTVDDFLDMYPLINILKDHRDAGNRVFSGAYIIIPEPGTANDKVEGAVRATRTFVMDMMQMFLESETQEQRFQALLATPGMGKFLSMQVLTDWGYLQETNPEGDFVIAGPGARRGAAHLSGLSAEKTIAHLTRMWEVDGTVRLGSRTPTQMDVQNTLCEFSKYYRFAVEGKPFRPIPYSPAHPGRQPMPTLPLWMR